MLLYRHRILIYCLLFLLITVQPVIYMFYSTNSSCENPMQIILPDNITNQKDIINLNTRILCWIPTTSERLDRAMVVYETWAKRCDRSIFIIAGPRPAHPLDPSTYPFPIAYIGDEKTEKYNQLPEKVLLSLLFIYQHYAQDYHWFFKGDDDTYVIMENLRHFLRRRPSNISYYYGYIAKTPNRFYASGGAGYVLSQEALLQFGEQILIKPEKRQSCLKNIAEDINLAYCLARIGIFAMNARDNHQLETFHPMTFEQHFLGKFTKWILRDAQFAQKKGEQCCARLTISFHSLAPEEMRMMHFLLYHIQKDNSPYADHIFTLDINMPTDFPFKPPKVKFVTPVYHPAIKDDGSICLDALGEKWTPNLSIVTILLQIIELMADPSTESPVMPAIAQQIVQNREEFYETARKYTVTYAQSKPRA